MREFNKGEIYLFECDKRGRNTNCDGYQNSKGELHRPFVILTHKLWNKIEENDGIYALPLTRSGKGNAFSVNINEESCKDMEDARRLSGSVILCDKLCRICETDIHQKDTSRKAELTFQACQNIKKKIKDFVHENII